ncbi:MAG: radical SAM peptide maturase, CXXX-repeat target family [Phycisphaerales bacterium]|nr:radical SAM peptide maturase, CXXX-repeat target family [Phycisphaerales bacterium]
MTHPHEPVEKTDIQLTRKINAWGEDKARNITFILTENCQLRCKYCYICGKNSFTVMTLATARKNIDYLLSHRNIFNEQRVIWEFIGGEPLLEIGLLDQICDYLKLRMYELDHPWFDNYRISLSTNGLLYDHVDVQRFIEKNGTHLSIGISIDGTKEKHDMQRVYPDGKGCYDEIVRQIPLWQKQFAASHTKATISHDDLHLVKDSVLHLWNLGIHEVAMNVVFENVWQDGDDGIFEQQLIALANTIIEQQLYAENKCTLFDRSIGFQMDRQLQNENWCGAGRMLSIDTKGNFHPCIRFAQYSLEKKKEITVGNKEVGYDLNKLRPFLTLTRCNQSPAECLDCEVASGCAWCQAYNYDAADTDTIFQRATYICKLHKARVRANNYLWNKLDRIVPPPEKDIRVQNLRVRKGMQSLMVLANSSASSFCHYPSPNSEKPGEKMSVETLQKLVYYGLTNNLTLNVIVGNEPLSPEFRNALNECDHVLLRPIAAKENHAADTSLDVFDFETDTWNDSFSGTSLILRMNRENLPKLPDWLAKHSLAYDRISLFIKNLAQANEEDFTTYRSVLESVAAWLPEREEKKPLELSFLTDRLMLTEPNHCDAGIKHLTVSPDGGFYLCPGFYYLGISEAKPNSANPRKITDIDTVLKTHEIPIKNKQLLQLDHAPICEKCDAYHCKRCIFLNRETTLEVNTPSRQQCVYAHLERNTSRTLIEPLFLKEDVSIPEIDYLDPFDKLMKKDKPQGKVEEC